MCGKGDERKGGEEKKGPKEKEVIKRKKKKKKRIDNRGMGKEKRRICECVRGK